MCDFSTKLIALQDGELPKGEASAIEQHIAVCNECRGRLDAYERISDMVNAYCDARLAGTKQGGGLHGWAPAFGAAASVALLLAMFLHARVKQSVSNSAATVAHNTVAFAPLAASKTAVVPASGKVRKHYDATGRRAHATKPGANWVSSEPGIRIAIPGEAILPPGALPEGVDFVADVTIAADGSAQRMRLQPRLSGFERAGFEGGPNQ